MGRTGYLGMILGIPCLLVFLCPFLSLLFYDFDKPCVCLVPHFGVFRHEAFQFDTVGDDAAHIPMAVPSCGPASTSTPSESAVNWFR